MKIERVTNITEWINAINPGEVKSAYLPCDKVQSLNCLASRHNQGRGKQRGKFVHYHYCSDLEVATIICETREDYLIKKMEKRTVGRPKSPRISDDDMKKIVIDQEETVMSVAALAKELGISTQAVRKRIERKLIPAHKKGRLWYILKSEYINAIRAL